MRAMSRIWTALVVGASILGLTALWSNSATAVPLSNTPIDWSTFLTWVDATGDGSPDVDPNYPPLTFPFDFTGNIFPDGEVFTAAYPGAGAAAGKWIYVYQVRHLSPSDVPVVNGISLRFITDPTADAITAPNVGSISSFYISSGNPIIGFGLGTVATQGADWYPSSSNPTLSINFAVQTGAITHIFGVFSSLPPTLIDATLRDSVSMTTRPLVYTPSPEPSAWMLLGLGLLGGLVTQLRRKK